MNSQTQKVIKRFRRNPVVVAATGILGLLVLIGILAPWLAPHSPFVVYADKLSQSPGADPGFYLGTDDVGRDLLSRLIYGARLSMGIGALAVLFSLIIGVPLGLIAGFVGQRTDQIIMRLTDMLMSLPNILLAIVLVTILGPGLSSTIWAVSVVAIPGVIRVVRSAVMVEKNKLYSQAARSYGVPESRILIRHLFPNTLGPLVVQASLGFSDAILNAAALGFLGLGAQPPTPEWGVMLADARPYMESAWWLVTLPGVCILVASLCFNLIGDGLREALDPRLNVG